MRLHPRDFPGAIAALIATAVGLALMVSGSSVAPVGGPGLSARTRTLELGAAWEQPLLANLEHRYGSHDAPQLPEAWAGLFGDDEPALARGRALYATHCLHCHGYQGDADTPTADILRPRPRDFSLGLVKRKSTPGSLPPTRADLADVLHDGIATTAMASFAHLPEADRTALVDYVQYLLMRSDVESRVAGALAAAARQGAAPGEAAPLLPDTDDSAEAEFFVLEALGLAETTVATAWRDAPAQAVEPTVPAATPAAVERGRQLYHGSRVNCAQCHGVDGSGRGPQLWDAEHGWLMRDVWGDRVRPADFAYGALRNGRAPEDVWRSIALGVAGSPMPAYAGQLTDDEISDLAHYVRSLAR